MFSGSSVYKLTLQKCTSNFDLILVFDRLNFSDLIWLIENSFDMSIRQSVLAARYHVAKVII